MFRKIVILSLVLVASTGLAQRAASQDDIDGTLSRAQALYYEARFKDSVDLLLPIDATLRQRSDKVTQRISVKLQLALGYIGQNQMAEAKSVFQEVCLLDSEYSLDAKEFAPKVLALFDDAKAEQKKARCTSFCTEVDKSVKAADAAALVRLAKDASEGCVCVAAGDAADLLYKQGVEAYKKDDFAQALQKLRAALRFRPQHDLAGQYAELAENKVKLTVDRVALDWRKSFDAQEFPKAASLYHQLESANIEGKANPALEQIREQYRKVVSSRVESWNQSCSTGSPLSIDAFRQQTMELLPNETIAADLVPKVAPCVPKAPEPVVAAAPGCLEMPSQQAMVRLKTRVNPEIQPQRMPSEPVNIRAKVKIDDNGNVAVKEIDGANRYLNEAMRAAIEKWKFVPAMIDEKRRCVETEIPIVLGRS